MKAEKILVIVGAQGGHATITEGQFEPKRINCLRIEGQLATPPSPSPPIFKLLFLRTRIEPGINSGKFQDSRMQNS